MKAARLKIYGTNWCGTHRAIVAARSQKEACELFGCSLSDFRDFGSQSSNEEEGELALSSPRTVFLRSYSGCTKQPWITLEEFYQRKRATR